MEAIRILQVLGRLDRGGAETMLMNLYRHMDRNRIQFDFVLHTREECDYCEEVRRLGGRIYSVPAFRGTNPIAYRAAWKRLFREHPEYRVLHSHIRSSAALYLGIAGKYGLITIIHSHNTSSGSGISAAVKNLMQLPLRYQADYLFACGRRAGEWLYGKKACAGGKFRLVPNAIEINRFLFDETARAGVRAEMGAGDRLVLGHVGRMERQKNHKFLIEIFEAVHRKRPDSVLWLAGTGILEEELRRTAREKGLAGSVLFLGSRGDVPRLMQGMDCFVFPSLFEGLPVTLVEAQTAGLPVAASDRITDETDVTGLVCRKPLEDGAESWAETVLKLARERDGGRAGDREMVSRAVKRAGYDIETGSRELEAFYIGAAEGRNLADGRT